MKKLYWLMGWWGMVLSLGAGAQYSRYIIRLKDKKGNGYSTASPAAFLSARAIARRARYNIAIDATDLPVTPAYLDSIKAIPNVSVLNVSKWLNQVCIRTTDSAALARINAFPFVQQTAPIALRTVRPFIPPDSKLEPGQPLPSSFRTDGTNGVSGIAGMQDYYNYGANAGQVRLHEGEYLHNLGFHGEGMIIAMLDAGFYHYKTNPAFDSLRLQNRVLGEWDYVAVEQAVDEDHYHGSMCLSLIAANEPGRIIGTAPKASFWLLRTEDASSEYPVEEQNWVAAAEFADSAGVDMISSSLGYSDFDDPSFNHSYAQRDGKTAMISIGASLAVKKGILVTNSAGNSGNAATDARYVLCPADADSVLTVGATDVNGTIAGFSSWGPNGAGKLKPNVVSVGQSAVVADVNTGLPIQGSGTSFSNPNICGLLACLWQAFPEFSNMEIIDAVQKSSSRYASPDYRYGYGIPNMRLAFLDLQQRRLQKTYRQALGNSWIKAFPVPFTAHCSLVLKAPLTGPCRLRLVDMNGKTIEIKSLDLQQDNIYSIEFSSLQTISKGVYTVQYTDAKNRVSLLIVRQ